LGSFIVLIAGPLRFPPIAAALGAFLVFIEPASTYSQELVRDAFLLSGFALIILSAVLLLFAIEFYDSASGWRGDTSEPPEVGSMTSYRGGMQPRTSPAAHAPSAFHFHLASIASNSTLVGVCLGLVGVSELLYFVDLRLGSVTTCFKLFMLVLMTEVERALWDAKPK
jgi:hypothetical protein